MACKSGIRVEDILQGELYGLLLKATGESDPLPESVVDQAILDAEAFYESDLHVFLAPTRIVSEGPARGLAESTYEESEPAYTYDSELFFEERWGFIDLNWRPIQSVTRFFFALPGNNAPVYEPTIDWIRPSPEFGRIQIVPMSGVNGALLSLNAHLFQLFSGGRGLPQSIYIDYTAGFTEKQLKGRFRTLLQGIRMRAALNLMPQLTNARTGGLGSASLSMDGLSRSQSFGQGEFGAYTGAIKQWVEREKEIRQTFMDAEGGVTMAVLGA